MSDQSLIHKSKWKKKLFKHMSTPRIQLKLLKGRFCSCSLPKEFNPPLSVVFWPRAEQIVWRRRFCGTSVIQSDLFPDSTTIKFSAPLFFCRRRKHETSPPPHRPAITFGNQFRDRLTPVVACCRACLRGGGIDRGGTETIRALLRPCVTLRYCWDGPSD